MSSPDKPGRPDLRPPPRVPADIPRSRRARASSRSWTWVAVVGVLAVVLAWVVLGLPRWVDARRATHATRVPAGAEEDVRAFDAARDEPAGEEPDPESAAREAAPADARNAPVGPSDAPPPATEPEPVAETTFAPEPVAAPNDAVDPFAEAMTRALDAVGRGDAAAARAALDEAARLRPDDPGVADVRARLERTTTGARLAALRTEATVLEADEDWAGAVARYEEALVLDPRVRFARDGLERAGTRLELDRRLAHHAARPERLAAADVRDEAEAVLDEAAAVRPQGPRLREQVDTVRRLLDAWSAPVRVVLESDERTAITVYHVGRLGTFARRALDLTPGTYTIVGSREGYRDVRATLRVEPGGEPVRLHLACTEEI